MNQDVAPKPNLDAELQFVSAGMTKSAFGAQVAFITLVTVVLFSVFVALFFFVFAARVEKSVVQRSITNLVKSLAESLKLVLTDEQIAAVSRIVSQMKPPDMATVDARVKARNVKLRNKAILILGVTMLVITIGIVAAYFGMRAHVTKSGAAAVAGENLPSMTKVFQVAGFGFAGVVVAEFVFLYAVAARAEPLDEHKFKSAVIDALIQIGQGPPPTQ